MYDTDDLPTRRYPALEEASSVSAALRTLTGDHVITQEDETRCMGSTLSTSLPVSAPEAYALMSQSERMPDWMAVVRSASTLTRYLDGRPEKVAFMVNLKRASMGYTLRYSYDDEALHLDWTTAEGAKTMVTGSARFQPLGPRACLMHYQIALNKSANLPAWGDDMYNGNPASSVISDFRDFVQRTKDSL